MQGKGGASSKPLVISNNRFTVIMFSLINGALVHPVPKYVDTGLFILIYPFCCAIPVIKDAKLLLAEAQ